MNVRVVVVALASIATLSCSLEKSPTASTPVAAPAPPPTVPSLPTNVPGVLALSLPIDAADVANTGFGGLPFGYHGADHALDGHAGWDIEYRIGGVVRAAAAGTIASVVPQATGRSVVTLEHVVGAHHYRTIYTNLITVSSDIVPEETVVAGQPLGVAGPVAAIAGVTSASALTHFQLDDLEFHREGPEPKAVSPEAFLTGPARQLFARLWAGAVYAHELVEPFATNPRDLQFPVTRTWTRAGGEGPAGIRFRRATAISADYTYELLAESGTTIERGSVVLNLSTRPYPSIDLVSPIGRRLGIYDIVSAEMRLTLASQGDARPATLDPTHVYRTR
jgi:Peptidase family M23